MATSQEPDYGFAWKALLVALAVVLFSAYVDQHPALKLVLSRGK